MNNENNENLLMFERHGVHVKIRDFASIDQFIPIRNYLVPLDWLITNLLFGLKVVCSEILVMLTKVIEDYVMLYLVFVNQDR